MKVKVERFIFSKNYTMSRVYINDEFFSFGLEPYDCGVTKDLPVKDIKEKKKEFGKIAIPLGEYDLVIDLSNKYKRMMPHILNVPAFDGVRVHSGNKVEDTLACLLLGKFYTMGLISESRKTCAQFEELLKKDKTSTITYTYGAEKQYLD